MSHKQIEVHAHKQATFFFFNVGPTQKKSQKPSIYECYAESAWIYDITSSACSQLLIKES